MNTPKLAHISLHVESPRQAANFYTGLFGMQVVRPHRAADPAALDAASMPAPTRSGAGSARSRRICLKREGLRIVLCRAREEIAGAGRLAQIGVALPPADVEALKGRLPDLGCTVARCSTRGVVFSDPYHVVWEVSSEEG